MNEDRHVVCPDTLKSREIAALMSDIPLLLQLFKHSGFLAILGADGRCKHSSNWKRHQSVLDHATISKFGSWREN